MPTENISDEGRKRALDAFGVRLLPSPTDRPHLLGASVPFGPFVEGDYITITLSLDSFIRTGVAAVVATATDIPLPPGVYDFVIPTGVTHVALISTLTGAVAAVWRS